MAKSKRPMVLIGYDLDGKPIYTRVSGNNQDERNDNIVKAYIKSGRIWELMPIPAYQLPVPTEPQKQYTSFPLYAQEWYARFKTKNRNSTHGTQRGWLKQACAFFNDESIEQIDDNRIQDFINSIQISKTTGNPCTTKGIKQRLTFLGEIFNRAIKDKLIDSNPCKSDSLRIGGIKGKGINPLQAAEIRKLIVLIRNTEDLQVKFWLALMLYSGLRREEMLGLRWEDIDFDKGTLQIDRAITYTSSRADEGDTKNPSSARTICMSDELIETLAPYKQPTGYLVADKHGKPFNDRGIKTLREKVRAYTGLPKLDARELRHSYATMLCEAGIDMKSIGTTMGHTKVSTTEGYIGTPGIDRLKSFRNAGIDYVLK